LFALKFHTEFSEFDRGLAVGTNTCDSQLLALLRDLPELRVESLVIAQTTTVAAAATDISIRYRTATADDLSWVPGPGVGIYTLELGCGGNDRERREALRIRDDSLCLAADLLLLVTRTDLDAEFDPALYTLRLALSLNRAVLWVQVAGNGVRVVRASRSRIERAQLERLFSMHRADGEEQWLKSLVPLFDNIDSLDSPSHASQMAQWVGDRVVPIVDAERARQTLLSRNTNIVNNPKSPIRAIDCAIDNERVGSTVWADRVAGTFHQFFSYLIGFGFSIRPSHWKTFLNKGILATWRQFFGLDNSASGSANANNRASAGAGNTSVAATGFERSRQFVNLYAFCDQQAVLDSGRFRDVVWLGYLLSSVAVIAAAIGIVFQGAHHAHLDRFTIAWLAGTALWFVAAKHFQMRIRDADLQSTPVCAVAAAAKLARLQGLCWSAVVISGLIGLLLVCAGGAGLSVWTVFEVVALATILALVLPLWGRDSHSKWLVRRALAERLRYDDLLLPVVAMSRIGSQPAFALDPEGLRLVNGVAWVFGRAKASAPLPRRRGANGQYETVHFANQSYLRGVVADALRAVSDQIGYHEARAKREHHFVHGVHRLVAVFFVLAALCVAAHTVGFAEIWPASTWALWLDKLASLGTIMFPVLGAALHAINTQLEYKRNQQSSQRMSRLLERRTKSLAALLAQISAMESAQVPWDTVVAVRNELAITADEMMSDVIDWFDLVAEQPMPLPA
jgi:hypothetical protein